MAKKPPPPHVLAVVRSGDTKTLQKLGQKGRKTKQKKKALRERQKISEWWDTVALPGNYHICPVD